MKKILPGRCGSVCGLTFHLSNMKRLLIAILFFPLFQAGSQIRVTNLRCEMLVNPLGIDVTAPRFSWQIDASGRGVKTGKE